MNEPGSRMVQQAINNCQDPQLVLAVLRWLEQNIQEVVLAKPSVHLALVVLESLGSLAAERNNQVWAGRLDKFILHLANTEVRSDESCHVLIFVNTNISPGSDRHRRPPPHGLPAGQAGGVPAGGDQ